MDEPIEKPIHRILDGQLKLCETSNPMLRKVVLMLLNDTVCRNNWLFEHIEDHLNDVAEIPILYSVINGKIANGHDFEMVNYRTTHYKQLCGKMVCQRKEPASNGMGRELFTPQKRVGIRLEKNFVYYAPQLYQP